MTSNMPFTPKAQAGESPLGLLRRAAIGNGLQSTLRMAYAFDQRLDHSGVALGTLVRSGDLFRSVCAGAGIPAADVEKVSYRRVGQGARDDLVWLGQRVPIGSLSFVRSKTCASCYHEHGISLSEWDHVAAVACSRHHTLLMDACPVCSMPWTYDAYPFACGCPRQRVLDAQTSVPESCATLLHSLAIRKDSAGLRILEKLCEVLAWWTLLGIRLTELASALALERLFHGHWPGLEQASTTTSPGLHPRMALAPLLAAPPDGGRSTAEALLRRQAPPLLAGDLAEWTMPATLAMAALGVHRMPFEKLVRDGHVAGLSQRTVSAASVNNLLWKNCGRRCDQDNLAPLAELRSGGNRLSLSTLLSHIESGKVISFDCPLEQGLSGLRLAAGSIPPAKEPPVLDLATAAARLHTNTESVRGAVTAGLLGATKTSVGGRAQWTFTAAALEAFRAEYVFASAIAKSQGWSVTTFASRLRSAGLSPVAGPGIDCAFTYIFRRSDVESADLPAIASAAYVSPAGRKKLRSKGEPTTLTTSEASRRLEVSDAEVRRLARSGWLPSKRDSRHRLRFRADAVEAFQISLQTDFVDLAAAARSTGETPNQFRATWIRTGFLEVRRFDCRELVRRDDLPNVEAIWRQHGTGSHIAARLHRSRMLCSNLEKMGVLAPTRLLGTGRRRVKLYARNDARLQRYNLAEGQLHD